MKKIYSILTSLLLLTVLSTSIKAQCAYNNAFYTTNSAPTVIGASVGAGDCIYAGEYNRITGLQAGSTYRISTCSNSLVPDTRVTVYAQGGVGGALAFNDDYCGLLSRLDFTPTTTGSYDILVDATGPGNTCVSLEECVELVITLIGTSSSTAYCIPTYTTGTSGGDFINGVSLGSINNQNTGSISGAAYSDFTSLSTSLSTSTSYTLAIKNNPDYSELVSAWIDYNQDFEFSEDERLGQIGIIANATGNINFTTPASPLSGNTRMRVRMVYSVPVSGGSIDPCLASSFGETEDYTVSFPSDPPGPPAGLTFSTSCGLSSSIQDNACPNYTSASISVSGLTSLGTTHIISSAAIIIEHPMAADLDLYLESPSGLQVLLTSDNGAAGSDYGVYSSSSCTQVSRFIMNAATSITSATAPFVGSYIPEGNLADFNAGTNPNGLWELKACDDMAGDIGTIRYFEIAFELNATEVPACADAYGIVDGSTNVELNQELSWTAGSGNPTSYDVYFGADANSLVLVSDNQTSTTYSPSNLAANTSYSYQIVPANNAGDAVGCPVVTFTTVADGAISIIQGNGSVTACSGNFFDSGGVNGNYSNSELSALTIYPETAGSAVQVAFSSFNLDNTFDFLAVVDGLDENAPILGVFSGSDLPGTLTATNTSGALTFLFSSDDVGNFDGWAATISCVPLSSVPACASNLAPVDGSVSASVTSQITWDAVSGATGYDVYFGTSASPSIVASNISATTFDPGALLNATTYYYNVVPVNANGSATDCPILSFTTEAAPGQVILMQNGTITTCDAAFFDSGNENADYSNDESYTLTLLPESPNSAVQVVFNSFDSEADFDVLNVYKGSDASGTLIQSLTGSITQPVSIVSTSADGALTFVFSSDFQIASSGWDASVSCVELPSAPSCVSLDSPADASSDVALDATLSWTAGTGATADSYDVFIGSSANDLVLVSDNQTGSTFSPTLTYGTTYFWSVTANNAGGSSSNCAVNSFTTENEPVLPPTCVVLASPADASTDVALDATLTWTAGTGATADSYDVFIGSSANDLVLVSNDQTGTSYTPSLNYATTYFWSVTANNAGGSSSNCAVNNFTTENEPVLPPSCVVLASPADASSDVALDATLSWTAGTGATADSYDVFIGSSANDLVLVSNDQTGTSYTPTLNYATTYFWSVTANNAGGSSTNCAVNSFTTVSEVILPPTCVTSTNPADASVGIALDATLSWTAGIGSTPDSYNVYFGTEATNLALVSENQVASSYSPVGLTNNTTYYWSVIAVNNFGESTNCTVNSFTTIDNTVLPPSCVTLDSPSDLATDVSIDATLSWTAASGETPDSYDVYIGSSASNLVLVSLNQTATSFTPTLNYATTYYWSVTANNAGGSSTNCSVNSFTTAAEVILAPACPILNSPSNSAIDVAIDAALTWTSGLGSAATSYDVFVGLAADALTLVSDNQTATSYSPAGLLNNTTYYWSVVANNAGGSSADCSVNSFTTIDIVPVDEILMQNGTLTLCSGNFFDTGGSANDYLSNEDLTLTIFPSTPGSVLQVNFTSFNTEFFFDFLNIYDGNSLAANQIGSFNDVDGPGIVTSTAADGSLTFNFTSDGSATEFGWVASISCIDPNVAPSCATDLSPANAATGISVAPSLSWSNGGGVVTDYDVYFGTAADALVLVSDNQTGTSFSPGALALNTTYFWQVIPSNGTLSAANCSVSSFTTEAVANIVMQNGSLTVCDANFFDSGNSTADYSSDENYTLTLIPATPGDVLEVNFSAFDTEEDYDSLYIYDGNSTSAPLIGSYSGNISPGSIQSTASNGSLTFVFVSDVSFEFSGWSASVSCVNPESAPNCATNLVPADASTNSSATATTLSWTSGGGGVTGYDVYFGTDAAALVLVSPNQVGTSYPAGTLLLNTEYFWQVIAINQNGSAVDCPVYSFTTSSVADIIMFTGTVSSCDANFFDMGGVGGTNATDTNVNPPAGNYSDDQDQTLTITPANANSAVQVTFNNFRLEANWDFLTIYNGPDNTYPQIAGSPFTGLVSPGIVTSTDASGALTFNFTSDGSGTRLGWDASISCVTTGVAPDCAVNLSPADGAVDVSLSAPFTWTSGAVLTTSYDVYFGNSPTTMVLQSNDQTATSWTPPALVQLSTYYWTVVANNASGSSVGCDTLSFTTGSQASYCVAEHIGTFTPLDCSGTTQEYINVATIGTIVNSTGCSSEPAYSDFTSLSTTAIQGNTIAASFEIGNYFTTDRIIVWADWNQDGDFLDAGEESLNSITPGTGIISGNIAVPAGASLGATRLRVRLFWGTPTSFDPCGNPSNGYGETEDYTVVVEALAEAPLCSTNPVPANAAVDVSANQSVLSWTDGGGSATYDVYFGTTSGSLVLVSDDQVGTSFDPGTLDLNTTYYWQIVPTNSIGTNNTCLETSFTTGGNVDVIMSNGTVTTCGANFYDSGNSTGTYQNDENYTLTFLPDQPGNSIQVVFNSFNTELNYDGLYVYNGPDATYPLISSPSAPSFGLPIAGAWQGNIAIGPFTSSDVTGALTFVFLSDGSITRDGWNATVSCIDATQLPACATITSGPADGATGICVNEAVFSWITGSGAPATTYDVYFDAGSGPILISDDQTATTYDIGVLDTNTTYTIQIVPSNANGEAVGCETITFTTGTCLNYCDAGATICDEYIANVQMGNINNATDCTAGGYNDYTSISADVFVGTPSPITISNGPDTYTGDQCGIWVDWNHDGDFTDANEAIAVTGTPGEGPYTALVNAPVDAFIGTTTMRVRITFTGIVDPCGTTTFGEVEDYSINVFGPLACPFPNNITTSETTTTNTVLTWDEVTSALEYQIRYRTATEPTTVATWSTPLVVTAPLTFSFLENLIACEDYILQIGSVCELGTAATFSSNILFGTRCIECTSDFTSEGEDCGQDLNGGCNSGVFGTIACGETICGTSTQSSTTRDTDWFSFDVATDGIYTVNVLAEFDGTVIFANTADCNNIVTPGQGNFFAGDALTLSTSLTAGTYSVIIVPSFDQPAFDCTDFNAYTVSLSSGDTQIAPVADVCETAAPFDLFATPVGGIWTGTGVSATGTFDPSISGIGSFDLTYEAVGTGCSSTATITVNVIAAPVVDFVGLAASYCSSVENVVLTGIPAGGVFSISPSVQDAIVGNVFNPSVLDAGSYDITYIANTGGSCAGTITQSVIITDGPVASIDNLASATCAQDAVITLTGTPANGVFSGNGVVGSTFDPSVSGTGPQTITYTISEAGNICPGIATAVIQVNPSPVVTLSGVSGDYCLNSGLITMIGTPALGSFLIDGVASGSTFDAATAGLGSHVLRYEFNNGTCTGFSEVTVNVVENLTVTFNNVPSPICSSSDPIVLTSTPDGAVFSGPGVVGVNTFDPSQAGIGTHTITATYTNGNCTATATQSVTVNLAPTASFNYGANGATVSFTNSSTNATSYSWDFGDGSALSTETNPSHTYTTNGSFTIVLTATTPNCGSSTFTAQLDLSVGIGSIDGVDMIQLYPNPTSGNVTLAFNSLNQQSFNVRITDATGRLIQTESMTNYIGKFNKTFDLSESAKGVYLFTVASEKGSINFRVVRD